MGWNLFVYNQLDNGGADGGPSETHCRQVNLVISMHKPPHTPSPILPSSGLVLASSSTAEISASPSSKFRNPKVRNGKMSAVSKS